VVDRLTLGQGTLYAVLGILEGKKMVRELELRLLEMCEQLLPKTTQKGNQELTKLLKDIRKSLER
jgi:hypothetical protein